jgi:hypothetical protein
MASPPSVASSGDIYVDADAGYFTSVSTIERISPNDRVSTLWKS